jgi:hypothetical protein
MLWGVTLFLEEWLFDLSTMLNKMIISNFDQCLWGKKGHGRGLVTLHSFGYLEKALFLLSPIMFFHDQWFDTIVMAKHTKKHMICNKIS